MIHRIAATALALACSIVVTDAFAVAQRTFVSTAGNDANTVANCSLVAPCRSFGSALTVTATNGEIIVLDSGGYGRVTVDKPVTIAAPTGVFAGISVFSGTNGIDILTPGIKVVLRGLTINNQGGVSGIFVATTNVRLVVENCVIANFVGVAPGGNYGIRATNAGGDISIKDTIVRDNGVGVSLWGGRVTLSRVHVERNTVSGIELSDVTATLSDSTSSGNSGYGVFAGPVSFDTVVVISDARIVGNAINGVRAQSNGSSSTQVAISRTILAANGAQGALVRAQGTGTVRMEVADSTVKSNASDGLAIVRITGAGASVLTITGSLISGNGGTGVYVAGNDVYGISTRNTITMNTLVGLSQSTGAVVETAQDNVLRGNFAGGAQTAGTITPFGWQ